MIIRLLQIIALLFILERTAYGWTVYDDGRYTITSDEVSEYITDIHLNEDVKMRLFNRAGRKYDQYQIELQKWMTTKFPSAIKEMSFYKLVEKISYIESTRLGFYIAFRNADEYSLRKLRLELFQDLTASVNRRVYNDKQNEMSFAEKNEAKEKFAMNLIQKGYPHQDGATHLEIYQDWYQTKLERLERQAILQLTADGIQEFEGFIQAQGFQSRVISPLVLEDEYQKSLRLLEEWKEQDRSHRDTMRFLQVNPTIGAIVSDFYPESPRFLAIEKIEEKYPTRVQDVKNLIANQKSDLTNREMIDEMISLLDMAQEMLADGLKESDLLEGKEMMMNEYRSSGEYHYIFTARAFDLAISLESLSNDEINKSIQDVVRPQIENIFVNLEKAIDNEMFFSDEYKRYPVAESAKKFAQSFLSAGSLKDFESKLLSNAIWIINLKFENVFKDFENIIVFELADEAKAKLEIEDALQSHYRNENRKNSLKEYTDNLFITIQPTPDKTIAGQDVFDFLFSD